MASGTALGYVVVTHLPMREPVIECPDIIIDLAEAREQRDQMDREWADAGRPGRYAVAMVIEMKGNGDG